MEEELSENELEARMYAMIYYVDETQVNVGINPKEDIVKNAPCSTIRRYWRTSVDQNNIYKKVTSPKESAVNKNSTENSVTEAKDEQKNNRELSPDLSIFQKPVPENIKQTIEIEEHVIENRVVELESSDEDEVIVVALPPKPTITIESSDEDDIAVISEVPEKKVLDKPTQDKPSDREVTASPVPSVVSSVSDEFIRGDCIALNISSKHPNKQSFDFSLHGLDLLGKTPTKKKRKKKNKDATSTPISSTPANSTLDECFATPKSKAKNKRQRTKSYQVSEKCLPNADVYDSDSNQSIIDNNKSSSQYTVTDKSLPNTDVYESDSNQSEVAKDTQPKANPPDDVNSSNSSIVDKLVSVTPTTTKKCPNEVIKTSIVDLTKPEIELNETINENIVMGNVTGLTEMEEYSDENTLSKGDISKCGSTKIPAILHADLDFDNLKGNDKFCKRRCYSLSTLRAEMEKFYNESWGGEDFNHREIQKNMSRDKNLWAIDPKDRMSSLSKRKITCNYCNRAGHRDDMCRMKPPVCFMCGTAGHFETRCPRKICVNCGSPNYMYSTMCRNCSNWNCLKCAECGQIGHPASHCPDVWRRYHNTVNLDTHLEENRQLKKNYEMFCSGCTRRGHLVHTCRITLPFSGLPINSPYVAVYRPVYQITNKNNDIQAGKQRNRFTEDTVPAHRIEQLKRQSKSPVIHETHLNKKRNLGSDANETGQRGKSPSNINRRKNSQSKDFQETTKGTQEPPKSAMNVSENQDTDKAPDFISITSDNHDKRGHIIQDNEVSDTSEVITSARVYVTNEIAGELRTEDGTTWLDESLNKNKVELENKEITFFLSIRGTVGNQEAFQAELRDWIRSKYPSKEHYFSESDLNETQESLLDTNKASDNIPKNRNNVIRKISRAFESLKKNLGEPKDLYKELVFLQNRHQRLLSQKIISPQQLSNNKDNINTMLRKLNMVLLGQAGLGDGSKHLSELQILQEKLTNFRQKNIPASLRREIGEHFHCIFTAIPRYDYVDLLGKYYRAKQMQSSLKKKKFDKLIKTPKKVFNIVFSPQNVNKVIKEGINEPNEPLREKTKSKLVFYHKRLLCTKPNDSALKRKKNELLQKLYFNIGLLDTRSHISSKALKKIKKVQEQAQLFLTHV